MYFFKKDAFKTIIFALLVSIAVAFSLLEIKKFQSEEENREVANKLVPYGSVEIKKVEFQGAVLERDGQKFTWKMTSPITDYLNYNAVEKWVSKALSKEGRNLSEGGESLNWSEFHLDGDDNFIKYVTIDDKSTSVKLSDKEAFDGSSYLRVFSKDSEGKLFSSEKEWREVFSQKANDFRSVQLFNWEVPSPGSVLSKISFYKKGAKSFTLQKTKEDKWSSEQFKDWTFDDAKVTSYISELQTYLHDGFEDRSFKISDKTSTIVANTDKGEEFSLGFYKKGYAVANYRPEHTVKVDKNAESVMIVDPLDLRSFIDVDGSTPNGDYDEVQVKNDKKIQKLYLKDRIWTIDDKDPLKETFNGAKVFIFLDKLKNLNYKRYVSDKGIYLKGVKKRIFLIKDGKELVRYSIGQDFPCSVNDKKSKNCVLVATNKVQKTFMVALKSDVNSIFRFDFKERN